MKKLLVMIAVLALSVSAFAFSASAATKEDVVNKVKDVLSDDYAYLYVVQLETVLNVVNPSAEVCDQLIALVDKNVGLIEDKGPSLHEYTQDEIDMLLADFDTAAKALGVTYEFVEVPKGQHAGDLKVIIYYNGEKITEIDGDAIATTGAEESVSLVWPIALGAVLLTAAAAFVFGKKVRA